MPIFPKRGQMSSTLSLHFRLLNGLLFSSLLLLVACKKTDVSIEEQPLQTPIAANIRFIHQFDGAFLLGGGNNGEKGFLMKADSSFQQFTLIQDSFPTPIYQAAFLKGRYVFSNGKAEIFYSDNLVNFYPHWLKEENFVPTLHQQPARQMVVSPDSALLIVSGGEFEYGLIQRTPDQFLSWKPTVFANELRTIHFTPGGIGWAGGLGILLKSANEGQHWIRQDFGQVFITAIRFSTDNNGLMSTFNAQFYFTQNAGKDWEKATTKGKSGYINQMKHINRQKVVAVGSNGTICISTNGGKRWDCDRRFNDKNLYDFHILSSNKIIVVGEDGVCWKVDI